MKVRELILLLGTFDGDRDVVGLADEFATFHPVQKPELVKLVKGNMLFSYNGEHWVEDDDVFTDDDSPVKVTERMEAVRLF